MINQLEQDIYEETYRDLEKLIYDSVWKYIRRFNVFNFDFDELLSEAHVFFMMSVRTFNSNKGTNIGTHVQNNIILGLNAWDEKQRKHRNLLSFQNENTKEPEVTSSFSVSELIDELKDDAQTIIRLALDSPKEIIEELKFGTHQINLVAEIKRHLKNKKGWHSSRISKGFEEIKYVLQN